MARARMGTPTLVISAAAVTPSDATILDSTKSLFVGVAGDVAVVFTDDESSVIFKAVVGFLPVKVKQVLNTGTDATNILALY
jgi:hypothetical protein